MLIDKGNHRHFMAKEIHEQPEVVGHTLANYIDMAAERVALPMKLPFDFNAAQSHLDRRLRHGLLRRHGRAILVRAFRAFAGRGRYRVGVSLPRRAARSPAILRSSFRNRARPPIRWRRCAMRASTSSTSCRSSTCRPRASRAKATSSCRRSPGRKSASPRPKHSPASWRRWPALAIAAGRARGVLGADDEKAAGARADRGAAPSQRGAGARAADRAARPRPREIAATCFISAAARATRSRSKAR